MTEPVLDLKDIIQLLGFIVMVVSGYILLRYRVNQLEKKYEALRGDYSGLKSHIYNKLDALNDSVNSVKGDVKDLKVEILEKLLATAQNGKSKL